MPLFQPYHEYQNRFKMKCDMMTP